MNNCINCSEYEDCEIRYKVHSLPALISIVLFSCGIGIASIIGIILWISRI